MTNTTETLQAAFDTLDLALTSSSEPISWCAEAAVALSAEVSAIDQGDVTRPDYQLTLGLFLLVFCDHFSRICGVEQEAVATLALAVLATGRSDNHLAAEAIEFHNDLANDAPAILELIGNGCANWTKAPNLSNLNSLRATFLALVAELEES
ncbi:hypothetical protein [Octadecabacter sp. R77987]|uniref:hypothetical protein n=1 Tax=Octadecabacter sp. R77987 TaxID=3093874 RepID=UPI00366B41C4